MVKTKYQFTKAQVISLMIYFFLSFAIAVPLFVFYTRQTSILSQLLLLIAGSFAPTLSAIAVVSFRRDPGAVGFWRRIRKWRASKRLYLFAVFLPSLSWLLAFIIDKSFGGIGSIQYAALASLPVVFLANMGEEIGWRGFALPHLLDIYKPLPASLILGMGWALFHLALYWQHPLFAFLIFPLLLSISVILTWLYLKSDGSVLLCTLFHAVFNTWSQSILAAEGSDRTYMIEIGLLAAVAVVLILRYGKSISGETRNLLTHWTMAKGDLE